MIVGPKIGPKTIYAWSIYSIVSAAGTTTGCDAQLLFKIKK